MIEDASALQHRLSGKQILLICAGLALITACVRIPLLGIPFERDEGEYAYIGWRLEHNELPYRDWVDQKPPAIFWIYRAAMVLPLDPTRAVHLAALLFSACSACALFFLARRFLSDLWSCAAAVILILLSADPWIEGTAANTEIFMLLPLILSQVAFFRALERPARAAIFSVVCGALIAVAISFKQVALVNWFFLVALFPIFTKSDQRWNSTFRFALLSAIGGSTVAAFIGVYFWARHGLAELVENVITHNLEYIGAMMWSDRFRFCSDTIIRLAPSELLVWFYSAAGLIALLATGKTRHVAFLSGWALTSAIAMSASGYFFPHYFQQWLPPLALLSVYGSYALGGLRFWKGSWIPQAVMVALLALLPLQTIWPFWFRYSSADAVRKIYPGNFFAEMPQFATRIVQITKPNERVFVFGAEPELLFYARRISATRYIFLFPLYGAYRNVHEKQIATTEEIQRNNPSAAVYVPNGLFFNSGTDQFFTQWSLSYLSESFIPDTCLIQETRDSGMIVPARPDLPVPDNLLAVIFKRTPGLH